MMLGRETVHRFVMGVVATCWCSNVCVAGDALHYQRGRAINATLEDNRVLIITDGQMSATERAVDLASKGLASKLGAIGSGSYEIEVSGAVTEQLLADLENEPGIRRALRVMRLCDQCTPVGVSDEFVVKFSDGVSQADREAFADEYDLVINEQESVRMGLQHRGLYVVQSLSGDMLDRVAVVQNDPRLADWKSTANAHVPYETRQTAPSDELFGFQWHLENTSQFGAGGVGEIDVEEAWESTLGSGIRVGMIDSGCDITHEDLAGNYIGVSQDIETGQGEIFPQGGHGTAVMGLMAAVANSVGVRGVAPEVTFTASNGIGAFGASDSALASAFSFAQQNDVDVHNNSWGLIGWFSDVIVEAAQDAALNGRNGKGMVITWATGNDSIELEFGDDFSTMAEVVAVGATGYTDTLANYSNYGNTLDITGPSQGNDSIALTTVDITGSAGFNNGQSFSDYVDPNYTQQMNGTSGAAPVVAGVAALVLAVDDSLNRTQVQEILTHTAEKVSRVDADYGEAQGFSSRYGYGRVNAALAVEAAENNERWPGLPSDVSIGFTENEGTVEATISWIPGGLPGDEVTDPIESDEVEILVVHIVQGGETAEESEINWAPTDGATYDGGDPLETDDGDAPDPDNENLRVLYSGPSEAVGNRNQVSGLAIGGEADEDQRFAIYAIGETGNYSWGAVFNQDGDSIGGGSGGGGGGTNDDLPGDFDPPVDPEISIPVVGLENSPQTSATASVTTCFTPCEVEFHSSVVTPHGIADEGWSFGDGNTSNVRSVTHTYLFPSPPNQPYSAVFFAQDDTAEQRVSTKSIQIVVLDEEDSSGGSGGGIASATIVVESTEPFLAGSPVRFSLDTENIGLETGSLVSYTWDFGDGNVGIGQTTENIFAQPGFYPVLGTVTEEFEGGSQQTVQASTIVHIQGTAVSGGSSQSLPAQDASEGDEPADACGTLTPAMVLLMTLGLVGIRSRRRPL